MQKSVPSRNYLSLPWKTALLWLAAITLLNYIAQIPYYIHFYGVYHIAPSIFGVVLLLLTLAIFTIGFAYTWIGKPFGISILVGFLLLEGVFYLVHNVSGAFLKDLPLHDPLFLVVSLIGYLNTIVPIIYLIAIIKDRSKLFQL